MSACIVGWEHLKFGRHDELDVEDMIVDVALDLLKQKSQS